MTQDAIILEGSPKSVILLVENVSLITKNKDDYLV